MSLAKRILGPLAVAGPILLILACDSSSPTATPVSGGPGLTPEVGAARPDQARAAGLGVPTATPVPAAAKQVALEYAGGHKAVDQDWERFRAEFDTWRTGLISCDASSVSVRLQQFAGDFAGITEAARDLPRTSAVRGMADRLIQAAEGEEEALRALRDTWILGSPAGRSAGSDGTSSGSEDQNESSANSGRPGRLSAFESVDIARSEASVLQKEVVDELSDRLARVSSQAEVVAFNEEFQEIALAWDQFHQDYDSFRAQEGNLTSAETVHLLSQIVDQFRNVVASVRQLPTFESTRRSAQILADAAQEEETALRNLRDTFQLSGGEPSGRGKEAASESIPEAEGTGEGESQGPEVSLGEGESQGSEESTGEAPGSVFIAEDPGLFNTFTRQLVKSNEARRQAQLELADVLDEVSSRSRNEVQDFEEKYQLLVAGWDSFHQSYDQWRKTEGGCDRAEVVSDLGRFSLQFSDIASKVRDLPRATSLRPMGELFVEAARLEEQALKELRNSWRPFDDGAFQGLDRERGTADKLRRQVTLGVQELLERYGLSEQATGS